MRTPVVTIGAIGPSAFCEAPAGLSLSSQRVRLKLSTSTEGFMLQSYQAVFFFSAEIASSWLETSVRFHFHFHYSSFFHFVFFFFFLAFSSFYHFYFLFLSSHFFSFLQCCIFSFLPLFFLDFFLFFQFFFSYVFLFCSFFIFFHFSFVLFFFFLFFFHLLFLFLFLFIFFLFPVVRADATTCKKSSNRSHCKKGDFLLWNIDVWASVDG